MATRILSVEIGSTITKISEMDYKVKNPKVYKYFCIPTPQGVLEDGFLKDNAEFVGSLKRALSENKIKTKQVVFSISSSKIVTREVQIPVIKNNQVGSYVKANANDYFPIDLTAYELAHIILGIDKGDDGKEKMRVMVMAAGKDLLSGYSKFASACGLRLVNIDYTGNSVYQIMKSEINDGKTKLVIKVEEGFTIASVISNRSLMLQRNIAYGFEKAVNMLVDTSDSYNLSHMDAYKQMCQKPCIAGVLSERTRTIEPEPVFNETEEQAANRKKITGTFSQLINNLGRMVELYHSKGPEQPISEVILVGLGADISGLSRLIANEIGIPTRIVTNFASINTYQMMDSEAMGKYVGVLGAAMEPVGLVSADSKGKSSGKKDVNYKLFNIVLTVVFLIVLIALLCMAFIPYNILKTEEEDLKQKEATYAQAEIVHAQFLSMTDFYNEVIQKHAMSKHSNDGLINFLTEMEEKMPEDALVFEFTSDEKSAVITFEVNDLEQAGTIMETFRTFESLSNVNVEGIEKTLSQFVEEGEEEKIVYAFSVHCYYFPTVPDASIDINSIVGAGESGNSAQAK